MSNTMNGIKPIKETTLADCLVFKRKTDVTQYGLEAAKIVLDAIRDLKLTGRVEFLSGDVFITGNYALCVCFEPGKGFPMKFENFWKPLRDAVQKHGQANGHLELEYWDCESFAVERFRRQFAHQGTIPFKDGLPLSKPNEEEVQSMWVTLAIKEREGAAPKIAPAPTVPPPVALVATVPATTPATAPLVSSASATPFPDEPEASHGKYAVQITVIKDGGGHALKITPKIKKAGNAAYTGNGNPQFVRMSSANGVDNLLRQIKAALEGKTGIARLAK